MSLNREVSNTTLKQWVLLAYPESADEFALLPADVLATMFEDIRMYGPGLARVDETVGLLNSAAGSPEGMRIINHIFRSSGSLTHRNQGIGLVMSLWMKRAFPEMERAQNALMKTHSFDAAPHRSDALGCRVITNRLLVSWTVEVLAEPRSSAMAASRKMLGLWEEGYLGLTEVTRVCA